MIIDIINDDVDPLKALLSPSQTPANTLQHLHTLVDHFKHLLTLLNKKKHPLSRWNARVGFHVSIAIGQLLGHKVSWYPVLFGFLFYRNMWCYECVSTGETGLIDRGAAQLTQISDISLSVPTTGPLSLLLGHSRVTAGSQLGHNWVTNGNWATR